MCYTECLESDIAYDGVRVYAGIHNNPGFRQAGNVRDFGNNGARGIEQPETLCPEACNEPFPLDSTTIWAFDGNTGEPVWSAFAPVGYRGGLMVTGGVVYAYNGDGNLFMYDSETGELLANKFFGIPVSVQASIGADSEGKHKILLHIGGGGGFLFGSSRGDQASEGSLAAFGLPDVLPEREVVQVPGPERIVEVQVPGPERIVEVEVPVPGPEVEVPVEVAVISPISYVAIGLGVVLVVIAGVLFTRRRST